MARRKAGGRGARLCVPGIWSGVIRELRDRESVSFDGYLDDPRQVLTLDGAETARLVELARTDADRRYEQRSTDKKSVTVAKAVLRAPSLGVPERELLQILRDRSLQCVSVHADDTIEAI